MLTVALPIYQNSQIAWLTFEGLSRQVDAGDWELIVCEETHWDSCAERLIKEYRNNLYLAGCKKITFLHLTEWVSLPKKWQLMGEAAHKDSIGFVLQASDCYPHEKRLKQTREAFEKGAHWYNESEGWFYDLWVKKLIKYNHLTLEKNSTWLTGLNMAFRTEYARNIPDTHLTSGIDHFLMNHCKSCNADFELYFEKPCAAGVDTNSANNISKFRINKFIEPKMPFESTSLTIESLGLPIDISEKLLNFELKYTNHEFNAMKKYRFLQGRNHFKRGDVHELSDVVAELYLKEGIVEPLNAPVKMVVKEEKQQIETKELKVETMVTKGVRGRKKK